MSSFFPTSSITHVVSCIELMPVKQANNFRVQPKVPEPFLHEELSLCPCRKIFLHVSPLKAQAFSSGTLPMQEFVVTMVIIKESKMKFMLLFECSSSKHKFTLVAMIYFFVQKDMLLKILYRSFLQMENLIFLFISLSQQNDNKNREFRMPPFWRLAVSIEIWDT